LPINYAAQIKVLPADSLEEFVKDWLAQRIKDYHGYELWRGTGDMGRDVTGYADEHRMEGEWDNFQCKQLNRTLSMPNVLVELGKIFMHAAAGEYKVPRAYVFVAPQGVQRAVQQAIAHPKKLQSRFVDVWDAEIAHRLVENANVPLTTEIEAAIKAFDFTKLAWLDAGRLVDDPACKAALVKWFGDDPGRAPRGVVPAEMQNEESSYVSQLLVLYGAKGPGTYPDAASAAVSPEHGRHFTDQRTRFFDAEAFDRFYRDSTPADYLVTFKDEIYLGVVDVHGEPHADGLVKLSQVMKHAGVLQASGILGKHAGPQVKQGTCHQFANERRLPWHP